jgi:hypothetical protein
MRVQFGDREDGRAKGVHAAAGLRAVGLGTDDRYRAEGGVAGSTAPRCVRLHSARTVVISAIHETADIGKPKRRM